MPSYSDRDGDDHILSSVSNSQDVDSDYREVLKTGLNHPDFRNPEWTSEYTKKDPKEKLSYEQYAFMVWNIIETIFDRRTIDKTWSLFWRFPQ